jgi:LysR family transcriptional regulator, nitrogen assimilation regulatory protein
MSSAESRMNGRERSVDLAMLRVFVRVAEVGSISEAAPKLGYSQPGLSQRVRTLERLLRCRLFVRCPQGVTLTEKGADVLPYARAVLSVADAMGDEATTRRKTPPYRDTPRGPDTPDTPDASGKPGTD